MIEQGRKKHTTEQLIAKHFPGYTVEQATETVNLFKNKRRKEIAAYAFGLNEKDVTSNKDMAIIFGISPSYLQTIIRFIRQEIICILESRKNKEHSLLINIREILTLYNKSLSAIEISERLNLDIIVVNEILEYTIGNNDSIYKCEEYKLTMNKLCSLFKGISPLEIKNINPYCLEPFILMYGSDKSLEEIANLLSDSIDNINFRINIAFSIIMHNIDKNQTNILTRKRKGFLD